VPRRAAHRDPIDRPSRSPGCPSPSWQPLRSGCSRSASSGFGAATCPA